MYAPTQLTHLFSRRELFSKYLDPGSMWTNWPPRIPQERPLADPARGLKIGLNDPVKALH